MILPASHLWPDGASVDARGHLIIGGCDTVELARAYGTPLYLLDEATFRASCRGYRAALARHYPAASRAHYASKALLNSGVAQLVAEEQLGLDVVSGGELYVALRAGFPAERIHLHGNAKPRAELAQALAAGIGKIVVDTLDELELLAQLTAGRAVPQAIMLRLAPDIAADTHAHMETGRASSKFGLPLDALDAAATRIAAAPGLRLAGLHTHLGSQIFDYAPITQAVVVLLDCAARLRDKHQLIVTEISPGGGLGTPYTADQPIPDLDAYVAAIAQAMCVGCTARGLPPLRLVVEPGRSIVARAGVALYEIVATKPLQGVGDWGLGVGMPDHQSPTPNSQLPVRYLHIDGGMADNIRPALYAARYTALLANRAAAPVDEHVHIAGRYCESGDVLIRDIGLPRAELGEIVAVATAGAYTLSMASNYNLAPRPALLLVGAGCARVIQRRETYADLITRDLALDQA
ncbi:MAG: diaminopimelate decarboxylase [Chloroflexota bacterium]|nr:diaminopimelate decarboxylase [Chloroflexota bacterium]